MHAISILGHKEEITQPIDSIWKLFKYLDGRLPSKYIVDHINTASFIKGLSYAASGYSAEMSIFLIQSMPWIFFPAGKKMNVLLASAHGQIAASHAKYALPEGSEILILGEDHYIKDNQYIVYLNQQNIIDIFDYIMNNKIHDISITNLTKIYLISAQDLYPASPYYMKVISHKLWGEPITKEFSCITALHQKTEEMITMREEKDHNYIKLLATACENGFNQPEPVLEEMWTIEYIKTTTIYHFIKMVEKDVEEAREVVYGNIWHYCSYFYTTLHDYILGHDIH